MVSEFIYEWEDDDGEIHNLEVHFEFIPGSKGIYNRLPEDCEPAYGPEIHILAVVNPRNGNEYTEDEWPVDEKTLIDAILDHMEDDNED